MSKGHKRLTDYKMRSEGYLLAAEAARKIGVTSQTIYKWIDADKIGGFRTGYRRYVQWETVMSYMGDQACKVLELTASSVFTETPE
jgi:excisionase family DNA binding protein